MNYYTRMYGTFDDANVEFMRMQRQIEAEKAQKERHEQWLRENIVSELNFCKRQRKMWLEMLEEARIKGDVAVILRKERDLEYNAKRLEKLEGIYSSVRKKAKLQVQAQIVAQSKEQGR